MPKIDLYFAPQTCARVSIIGLEEIGAPYSLHLVSFVKNEHRAPSYTTLNPKAKVPLMLVDGQPLTETVAIATYLARTFPKAELLPLTGDPFTDAKVISDLAWCASGMHPIITRVRLPHLFCSVKEGLPSVQTMAADMIASHFRIVEDRLSQQPWMCGEKWSLLDAYVYWIWFRITEAGVDSKPYPRFADHAKRIEQRPSVQRALAIEQNALSDLDSRGLGFKLEVLPN